MESYMCTKEIIRAATSCDGTVFGGAVRDLVRKDYMCKEYFSKGFKKETFSDPSVCPETADRLLVPSDIDIHFTERTFFLAFRKSLRDMFYDVRVVRGGGCNLHEYNTTTMGPGVRHFKMVAKLNMTPPQIIKYIKFPSKSVARKLFTEPVVRSLGSMTVPDVPEIKIDIVISKNLAPPFSNLDFRCNGLVMDSDGVHLCDDLASDKTPIEMTQELVSIFEEIRTKRAIAVILKGNRWDKMESKGWTLSSLNMEHAKDTPAECLICLGDISPTDGWYKLKCCPAKYCMTCLSRQITHPHTGIVDSCKCPHCRQLCVLTNLEVLTFGALIENV